MEKKREERKYIGKFLESDYEKFEDDFLGLLRDYKRKTQRLDKIIEQSDKQQFRFLKMNEQLQEYKKKLENRIETDKILFQKSRHAQMGEMISMIAHQWRQPLTAINSTIIGMQLNQLNPKFDLNKKDELEKFFKIQNSKFDRINTQVKLLSDTINDFRNFFNPNQKKELVPISSPVVKALSIVEANFKNKNIAITTNFNSNQKILIHKNEILQVILNILKNSEDNFNYKNIPNAQVTIETSYDENDNLSITIEDNGGGIAEEILPNIFDPYFSTKEEKNGTGIGLYMSKMIIEEHNHGELIAQNQKDGVCFKILWAQNDKTTN